MNCQTALELTRNATELTKTTFELAKLPPSELSPHSATPIHPSSKQRKTPQKAQTQAFRRVYPKSYNPATRTVSLASITSSFVGMISTFTGECGWLMYASSPRTPFRSGSK